VELQEFDIFKDLTKEHYDMVIKSGSRKVLKPKSILFHQGDSAKSCYLVEKGHLKLTKLTEQGREVIIRYINPGELTAAMAVLNDKKYPVTAESVEKTSVVDWDKPTILSMMKKIPDIAIKSLSIVFERLDEVQNRYMELCTERVEQRVARTMVRLIKTSGLKTVQGICLDIPLSRQNIADYTGTTVFTVSRILSTWEKMGWIKSEREKITIVEAHTLYRCRSGT
jgi:CRP-like cAMP-binding protein